MTRPLSLFLAAALGTTALPALADVPKIITDTPITGSLVQEVMGDLGQPEVLLTTGGDPHHFQMRPRQTRSLQDADLLIWVGPELTPWLEQAASGLNKDKGSLVLLNQKGTVQRQYAGDGDDDDDHAHHDEHEHDHDHAAEGEAGHVHMGVDPHAWLNPQNAQVWLGAIADTLSQRDPEHAATYVANAEKAKARIAEIDTQLATELAPFKDKRFVVFHDAYGYFTDHYDLQPAIAVSLGDATTPSAARLSQIRDQITAEHAVCAFPEANHDPRLLHAVTEKTDVRAGGVLDPEGSTAKPGAGLYDEMLRGLGKAMTDCLGK